jgi:hypothetical protein
MNTNILFWSYLALILVEIKNVSDESCRENQNEHMFNFFFFSKIVPFINVEKYCSVRQSHRWQYGACLFSNPFTFFVLTHSTIHVSIIHAVENCPQIVLQAWVYIRILFLCHVAYVGDLKNLAGYEYKTLAHFFMPK